jgi:hypothetical protein
MLAAACAVGVSCSLGAPIGGKKSFLYYASLFFIDPLHCTIINSPFGYYS